MTRIQAIAAVRALLNAGLTIREVAERLQAHPRAVAALAGNPDAAGPPSGASDLPLTSLSPSAILR